MDLGLVYEWIGDEEWKMGKWIKREIRLKNDFFWTYLISTEINR